MPPIGVVFSFVMSLLLDCYHFFFLTIWKNTLTFLSLANPVLQSFVLKSKSQISDMNISYDI